MLIRFVSNLARLSWEKKPKWSIRVTKRTSKEPESWPQFSSDSSESESEDGLTQSIKIEAKSQANEGNNGTENYEMSMFLKFLKDST